MLVLRVVFAKPLAFQEEFNFLTDEEFEQLNRFRLLRLRNEEVTEFRNLALVPCQEHEIMDSTFTPYERRMKEKTAVMVEGDKYLASGVCPNTMIYNDFTVANFGAKFATASLAI